MVVVAIIGLLAALAIPNFIRFQAKSKQSEVKTSLRAIFTGQTSYYSEYERYSSNTGEVAFAPERGNRYSYDLGATTITTKNDLTTACPSPQPRVSATAPPTGDSCGVSIDVFRYGTQAVPTTLAGRTSITYLETAAGVAAMAPDSVGYSLGSCPACNFSARAVGNIDNDTGGDEWFVGSQFANAAATTCAEAFTGMPPGTPLQARNDVSCE
jgi:type IV pilus assembly protein PilA